MKMLKSKTWQHEITGSDGNVILFGVNIFLYQFKLSLILLYKWLTQIHQFCNTFAFRHISDRKTICLHHGTVIFLMSFAKFGKGIVNSSYKTAKLLLEYKARMSVKYYLCAICLILFFCSGSELHQGKLL